MTRTCEQLDDYIAHDLADDVRARFVEHLTRCAECRAVVAANERLDRWLAAAVEREPLPHGVIRTIERRIDGQRLRRFAGAIAAVAASLAAIWLVARPHQLPVVIDRPRIDGAPAVAAVRVKFPNGDVIAVHEPVDVPNVTFLWVHPTLSRNSERSLP